MYEVQNRRKDKKFDIDYEVDRKTDERESSATIEWFLELIVLFIYNYFEGMFLWS